MTRLNDESQKNGSDNRLNSSRIKTDTRKVFDGPTIYMGDLILCNIQEFWDKKDCPRCRQHTRKESVRVRGLFDRRYVYTNNAFHCMHCDVYYVSRETLEKLNLKAKDKFGIKDYVNPGNVSTQTSTDGKYLFVPKAEFKSGAPYYDVKYGGLYTPNAEERMRITRSVYEDDDDDDDDWIPLREKSILGECGYSVNLPEAKRKWVLEGAVNKYGQRAVIDTIERNIRLREMQKKDFSRAIGIWRRDIEFVRTVDESEYLRNAELEWKKQLERYEEESKRKRIEREKYFAEQNVFWWESKENK